MAVEQPRRPGNSPDNVPQTYLYGANGFCLSEFAQLMVKVSAVERQKSEILESLETLQFAGFQQKLNAPNRLSSPQTVQIAVDNRISVEVNWFQVRDVGKEGFRQFGRVLVNET